MANVYVLYTGGTIGCIGDPLVPMSGPQFEALVGTMPGLQNNTVAGYTDLTYAMDWFETTLDSSNMTPADWVTIAQRLAQNYAAYDGFVVLHGTDTMAFSAAAMSFFLPGLSKPVIFTGSQLPLSYTLNDGLPNLVAAIVLAGTTTVPESCLYFDSLLLRGNRAVKVNANQFAGFNSPNYPPLALVGTEMTLNSALMLPAPPWDASMANPDVLAQVQSALQTVSSALANFSVVAMILFPGIGASVANAMINTVQPPVTGVVLEAFGEGNGPTNADFLSVLSNANAAGVVLMDNTQVLAGAVNIDAYATGSGLAQAGALSAYDMTPEASLAKLVYLFGIGYASPTVKTQMQVSLAGELTLPSTSGTTSLAIF